jgi:acetyl esterase
MQAPLDDEAASVLEELADERRPPTRTLAPTAARAQLEKTLLTTGSPSIAEVREVTIDGPETDLIVRLYYPGDDGPYPGVCYFHGGGWVEGSIETHDALCRRLATASECVLASVDYRRAPEYPFPNGLEDCYAATRWLATHGEHVDVREGSLSVAGDSAGGALAAGVSLLATDRDDLSIDHQVLLCPMVRSPAQAPVVSLTENATGGFLQRATIEHFYNQYCSRPTDRWNAAAFPLLADDLSGLPSTTLLTAGHDPLRDEGAAFAERLTDAGVAVDHRNAADQPHVFVLFADRIEAGGETIDWLGDRLATELDE